MTLEHITNMSYNRWYPTPTLLPSGKVMIMGGTQVGHALRSHNSELG
jgi:hypothetical protein